MSRRSQKPACLSDLDPELCPSGRAGIEIVLLGKLVFRAFLIPKFCQWQLMMQLAWLRRHRLQLMQHAFAHAGVLSQA